MSPVAVGIGEQDPPHGQEGQEQGQGDGCGAKTQGVLCSPLKSMQGVPAVKQFRKLSELLAV